VSGIGLPYDAWQMYLTEDRQQHAWKRLLSGNELTGILNISDIQQGGILILQPLRVFTGFENFLIILLTGFLATWL
jgi:hypothetical protein